MKMRMEIRPSRLGRVRQMVDAGAIDRGLMREQLYRELAALNGTKYFMGGLRLKGRGRAWTRGVPEGLIDHTAGFGTTSVPAAVMTQPYRMPDPAAVVAWAGEPVRAWARRAGAGTREPAPEPALPPTPLSRAGRCLSSGGYRNAVSTIAGPRRSPSST